MDDISVSRPTFTTDNGCPYNPFLPPDRDDPHPALASARQKAPVFWSELLGAWVITTYDALVDVFGDAATYINAGATAPLKPFPPEVQEVLAKGFPAAEIRSLLALDGKEHARSKKFVVSIFTARRVNVREDRTRATANKLIDSFIAAGHADFVTQFAYYLPLAALVEMIGIPVEDCQRLHNWSTQKLALQWGSLEREAHVEAARGYVDFQLYLKRICEARRQEPTDDLISAFIQQREEGEMPLSDGEIVGLMMAIIAAGHETTTSMLSTTLYYLLRERKHWLSVCNDRSLIPNTIDESLRFDAPAATVWRRTTRDVVVAGVHIPVDEQVAISLSSANRDREAFAQADEFIICRKAEKPHLAFGRGIHFCPGAALARLVGRVAFETLCERAPIGLRPGF